MGYTFRPRSSRNRYGKLFVNFTPAISEKAKQKARDKIKSWYKEVKSNKTLKELIKIINPVINGWVNYYGRFNASELWSTMWFVDTILMKWTKKKYAKLKQSWRKAKEWFSRIKKREPKLFAHWKWMQRHDLDRRAV